MKTNPSSAPSESWCDTSAPAESFSQPEPSVAAPAEPASHHEPPTLEMPGWKRTLDLLLVAVALPVLLPLLILLSLWIRFVAGGPVLFRQVRVGHGGKPFTIYKFRSMKKAASTSVHTDHVRELMRTDQEMVKLDQLGDSRLIPGGAIIRMTGLDELPQLLNVVRGEMSLVGPRPCLPEEYELYTAVDCERLAVHPGLTGYWQVKGKNQTRFSQMVAMDCHYVRERSLALDLWIIMATPRALLKQVSESEKNAPRRTPAEQESTEGDQGVSNAAC